MDAVIIEKITKKYGDITALDEVSLNIKEGEIFGLLGPNGAGKTTLMEIMVGLRRPDSGGVTVLGVDVTKGSREIGKSVGFNPQETMLYDDLTVLENLEFIASLYSFSREKFNERLRILSEMLELSNFLKRRAGKLSGGQKRRVSLAASLLHDPPVVVLDEPTVGLDPDARREFWRFIEKMREEGKTILISTHYMEEADELCDRVAIMDLGKVVAIGSPDELKRSYGGSAKIVIHVKMRQLASAEKILSDYAPSRVLEWLEIMTEKPEELVPDLIAKLQSAGIDSESVEIRSPTLEDVFLNLTGRRLEEVIR